MSVEVYKNLFVGNKKDCEESSYSSFAIVHGCKSCHQNILNYRGSLPKEHPNYLIFEKESNLYLNLVDMEKISPKFTDQIFEKAYKFIDDKIGSNKVLVHCDQGQSRSCSIALYYLARKKYISNNSFSEALYDFKKFYPEIKLGVGFFNYLQENWQKLMK